ncbi:S-adenosyl-L-methionine-dependent methyltransferase [Pseudomassariella vexata]|uniref:S-adenosyl-L-methionine-dependent methyltransferase n=1 Tax=Pseudomassariella vexata TaxID=1141098 RepID=A0A1Y2DXP3_9PEZI|nr:S-adenosyl-L-methionine-dependent methyltransferase [Pseudomassariella vexata]ORY64007.1 S-adenosyl-L-methionine-dependent methyltransferase [Pseudomassariella vexata]
MLDPESFDQDMASAAYMWPAELHSQFSTPQYPLVVDSGLSTSQLPQFARSSQPVLSNIDSLPNMSPPLHIEDQVDSVGHYPHEKGSTIPDPLSYSEHGRTFQAYKQHKYDLPNDAVEQDRLDLGHSLWRMVMNDTLHWAPVDKPSRVLDIGTGTGIWAIEFAELNPQAKVIGTDLSLIQPDMNGQLPNLEFIREDVEEEWTLEGPFDFVHLRLMFTCFNDHRSVMRKAYDSLRPGGWIEYQDSEVDYDSDDYSHRGTALHKWNFLIKAGAAARGRDIEVSRKYKEYLMQIGFVDVVEKKIKVPGNPWPAGRRRKEMGEIAEVISTEAVQAMSPKMLGDEGLGMSPDAVQQIVSLVQGNIHDQKIHITWPFYVVCGRKPFPDEVGQHPVVNRED